MSLENIPLTEEEMTLKKGSTLISSIDTNQLISSRKKSAISMENSSIKSKQNTASTIKGSENEITGFYSQNLRQSSPQICFTSPYLNGDFKEFDEQMEEFKLNSRKTSIDKQLKKEQNYFQGVQMNDKIKVAKLKFEKVQHVIEKALKKLNYQIKKYLDLGGEGIIFEGNKQKAGAATESEEVVLKILLGISKKQFLEETQILNTFERNINIIKLIDHIEIEENEIYIYVLEKCKYSLSHQLKLFLNKDQEFTLLLLLQMLFDLVDGLIQLRIYNVLHLDIKPGNILISQTGEYLYSDFGLSSSVRKNKQIRPKGLTHGYAPDEQENDDFVDFQTDVFSLGKTLMVILQRYRQVNFGKDEQLLSNLEDMVSKHMTQQKNYDRENCWRLHEILFKSINLPENKIFFKTYSQKIKRITTLFPFDNNKDISYFLNLQLYYNKVLLEIQKELSVNLIHSDIADTQFLIGQCYSEKGEYENALLYQNQALEIRRKLMNEDDILIAQSLHYIGLNCYYLGEYQKALDCQLQTLEIRKNHFKGNHIDIATAMNNLGNSYEQFGDLENALKHKQDSLQMRKSLYKDKHPTIGIALNSVGICYIKSGDPKRALDYELRSLEMHNQLYKGQNHPKISDSLSSLGHCYYHLREYKKALGYCFASLKMRKYIYQNNHPSIAQSLYRIGLVYLNMKQYDYCLIFLLESLKMRKTLYQDGHPLISQSLATLGLAYIEKGDYVNGMEYSEKALSMQETRLIEKTETLNNIGLCYYKSGNLLKGLVFYLHSLEIRKQKLSRNHPDIVKQLQLIGLYYYSLKDYQIALIYLQDSLKIQNPLCQKKDKDILEILDQIGQILNQEKDFSNALIQFNQALI